MHKLIYILFFLFPLLGFSQADTIAHLYTFGGNNNDNAEEIEATSDGGYIVVGSTSSNSSGNTDVYLLKVDSLCSYEWSYALGGTNNDWGYSVKQTYDKGYIIAASSNSFGNGGYDAVLMKRDSLGNYVWQKTYGGLDWDFAYSVVQTYDSGYVFCGETFNNSNGFSDVYIVKTNPIGDTLWTRTFGGSLIDKGNAIIETSDSNIVIAGITNTVLDSTQVYIIKLASNGALMWDSIYGDSLYEQINNVIETTNGDYVLIGGTTSIDPGIDESIYLLKVGANGNLLWERTYGYSSSTVGKNDEGIDLKELSNGDLLLVSSAEKNGAGKHDISLIQVNGGGWWIGIANTIGSLEEEIMSSLTIGKNGNILLAGIGTGFGQGNKDVLLVRLDTIYSGMDTLVITIEDMIPLTIDEQDEFLDLLIYPNPAQSYITIVDKKNSYDKIVIYDISSKIVFTSRKQKRAIDISSLKKGLYILTFQRNGEVMFSKKLLKN